MVLPCVNVVCLIWFWIYLAFHFSLRSLGIFHVLKWVFVTYICICLHARVTIATIRTLRQHTHTYPYIHIHYPWSTYRSDFFGSWTRMKLAKLYRCAPPYTQPHGTAKPGPMLDSEVQWRSDLYNHTVVHLFEEHTGAHGHMSLQWTGATLEQRKWQELTVVMKYIIMIL